MLARVHECGRAVQRLSRRGEVVGCGGGWRGEEGRSSSGREAGGARGSRRGEEAGSSPTKRVRPTAPSLSRCRQRRVSTRGRGGGGAGMNDEREREGGTHHSARQPGGSGGWGMAWASTGLGTQTCAACTNPHKRRCLSTSPAPPTTTRPPTRRRILFFGADAFSCHVFTQLHSARAGPSLRPSPPPSVAVADLPPSAATDLVDSLTVVVPPDQRTGRRLKHVHRRALLPPSERETQPRPMS